MTPLSATSSKAQASLDARSTEFAKKYVQPGNQVMDVGCGNGAFTIELAKMVGQNGTVYAIDSDPAQIEKAKETARLAGVSNITFAQMDVNDFLASHSNLVGNFDVVHCRSLLKKQVDPSITVQNMLSFLKQKTKQQLEGEGKKPFLNFLARDGTLLIEEFEETNYSLPGARPFSKLALSLHSFATKFFSLFQKSSFKKSLEFENCKEKVISNVVLKTEKEKKYFAEAMETTSSAKELEKIVKHPKASIIHRKFIQIAL